MHLLDTLDVEVLHQLLLIPIAEVILDNSIQQNHVQGFNPTFLYFTLLRIIGEVSHPCPRCLVQPVESTQRFLL